MRRFHGGNAAVPVRDLAGEVGAGGAAQQGNGDGEAVSASLMTNSSAIASTAPLTTDESKPKRNPPTAPATARPITFRETGGGAPSGGLELDMGLPWGGMGGFGKRSAGRRRLSDGGDAGALALHSVARHIRQVPVK